MVGFGDAMFIAAEISSRRPKPPLTNTLQPECSPDLSSSSPTTTSTSSDFSSSSNTLTTSTSSSSSLISDLLESFSFSISLAPTNITINRGGGVEIKISSSRDIKYSYNISSSRDTKFSSNSNRRHDNCLTPLALPPSSDLISNLPASVRLHILSFLPIRAAIQTTCLSKRWLHLWIWMPQLSFSSSFCLSIRPPLSDFQLFLNFLSKTLPFSSSSEPSPPTQAQLFVDFINRSVFFHSCCKLGKFSVEFGLDDYAAMSNKDISGWLQFATRANVKDLVFDLNNAAPTGEKDNNELIKTTAHYEVPQQVYYQGHTVAALSLSLCYINPNHGVVNWKSLKVLSLQLAKMSEDAIQRIISGSPALDTLELSQFSSGIRRLEISNHASLRKLVLGELGDPWNPHNRTTLEIIAPTIVWLEISGLMCHRKYRMTDVRNLVDCALNMEYLELNLFRVEFTDAEQRFDLQQLLQSVTHVKNLTLGKECLVVLTGMFFVKRWPPICNHTCLVLEIHHVDRVCHGIREILKKSPFIETLIIHMRRNGSSLKAWDIFVEFAQRHWASWQYPLPHLKTIYIYGFYNKFPMPFVGVLLQHAPVLEKMIIEVEKGFEEDFYFNKITSLMKFPRASPKASIFPRYQNTKFHYRRLSLRDDRSWRF